MTVEARPIRGADQRGYFMVKAKFGDAAQSMTNRAKQNEVGARSSVTTYAASSNRRNGLGIDPEFLRAA